MPDEPDAPLPWAALKHTEGDIPWPALERFADALAEDPGLWPQLRGLYEAYFDSDLPTYEFLYVPAIVALAAPRLGPEMRFEIAAFLVDEAMAAAEDEDDLLCEVTGIACGALGPDALPAILEALDDSQPGDPGWVALWPLTCLAAESSDPAMREGVAARCIRLLVSVEANAADIQDACLAADTLAKLKWAEARPLIERLWQRTRNADLREALRYLDGKADPKAWKEMWEDPVREWVQERWEWAREQAEEDEEEPEEDDDQGEPSYELEGGAGWEQEEEADEVQPGPPLQSPPTVGRNDPCPCGSGKKFKKCCGR